MSGKSLNPGDPPRKRSSFCKFLLWLGVIVIGIFLGTFIVTLGKAFYNFTQFSHSRIFQNQTLAEVKNRAAVVRPLIDEHQSFDIAMSIWSLPVAEDDESAGDIAETPLYSDIVFRGLRLSDKHKRAVLAYKLSVTVFGLSEVYSWRLQLKENDLRASFVTIPASPSLGDYVANFSTWRPETMRLLRAVFLAIISTKFPLGASNTDPQTVADKAFDSFGISIPLLEFHEIRSKCANDSGTEISENLKPQTEDKGDDADEEEDEEEEEAKEIQESVEVDEDSLTVSNITKNPLHAVKRHPYVVTRSYSTNGHWETRLELQIPDEATGELRTEWAYAPYIGHGAFSAGAKPRRVRITPLTDPLYAHLTKEFMEVKWQLSYSGRTPVKFFLDSTGIFFTKTPIRGVALSVLSWTLPLLELGYWYTRTSTVSISVSGTLLSVFNGILGGIAVLTTSAKALKLNTPTLRWSQWLGMIVTTLEMHWALPLFMLKAITRLEISPNNTRWFPSARLLGPTHKERNSHRLDSRTGWGVKAGVCISLIAIHYLLSPHKHLVISGRLPHPSPGDLYPGDDLPSNAIIRVFRLVSFPLELASWLSQFLLNQRSKTFAGSYKITIFLRCIGAVLTLIMFLPSIVGWFEAWALSSGCGEDHDSRRQGMASSHPSHGHSKHRG
ncbi:hypothetical protein DFH09DRAFT_1453217 [Mycena vulgaris]|nr:hypothetical protein DFH09DRAFT_1453217 [Mycena vulgaris]